jgi:arylsulfatase A-like enzyme
MRSAPLGRLAAGALAGEAPPVLLAGAVPAAGLLSVLGTEGGWGAFWRSMVLLLLPLFAAWFLVSGVVLGLSSPAGVRLRRIPSAVPEAWQMVLVSGTLAALVGGLIWLAILVQWAYLDLPWYLPWIPWEMLVKAGKLPLLGVGAGAGMVGMTTGILWLRLAGRPMGQRGPARFFLVLALALAGYNFWVASRGYFGGLESLFDSVGFILAWWGFRQCWPGLQRRALAGTAAGLIVLGAGAGLILSFTGMAAPSHATRAHLAAHRPFAMRALAFGVRRLVARPVAAPPTVSNAVLPLPGRQDGKLPNHSPDVLLVTIDALSADRCSAYGYQRETTPALDRLATSGVLFQRAYSPGDATARGIAPLLLSRYEDCLGRDDHGEGNFFLALRALGYQTVAVTGYDFAAGVTASYWPDIVPGFAQVRYAGPPASSRTTNSVSVDRRVWGEAVSALGDADPRRPLALWVHFYDPHNAHVPDAEFAPTFGKGASARLDAEIRTADQGLGALLEHHDAVRNRPRIVVVSADHGQSLGEDGRYGHNKGLYRSQTQVPLVLAGTGIMAGGSVSVPVSTLDVGPTILGLLGVGAPIHALGRSLVPAMTGEPLEIEPIYFSRGSSGSRPLADSAYGVLVGDLWLTRKNVPAIDPLFHLSHMELFDLAKDRGAQHSLADRQPGKTFELNQLLETRGAGNLSLWCRRPRTR